VLALAGGGLVAWALSGRAVEYGDLAGAEVSSEPSPDSAYTIDRVRLQGRSGGRVDCYLRRPVGGVAPGRAAIVLFGGIGTGRRAAMLVDPRYGGAILSCDYPWADPSRGSIWRALPRMPAIRGQIVGTPGALALAASYLASQPGVDTNRLAAIGASLAVPFVAAWAADDRRVAAVALIYGGGDLGALFEANLRRRVGSGWLRRGLARGAAILLGPLEPARTVGRISPRPILLVGSRDDERIPRASVDALVRAAGEPKTLVWFDGRHMMPRDTALLRLITDSTVAWLERTLSASPSQHQVGELK